MKGVRPYRVGVVFSHDFKYKKYETTVNKDNSKELNSFIKEVTGWVLKKYKLYQLTPLVVKDLQRLMRDFKHVIKNTGTGYYCLQTHDKSDKNNVEFYLHVTDQAYEDEYNRLVEEHKTKVGHAKHI